MMNVNVSVIGGADGPTAIFLAGKIGLGWLNLFGLGIVIIMLLPNLAYFLKYKGKGNKCGNTAMNVLEQAGRYASMFLMVFNIGIAEFGFTSLTAFFIYLFGNVILLLVYMIIWFLYMKKSDLWKSMALAVLPTGMFLLSGVMQRHVLLVVSAVLFGIGHIYVTYQNAKCGEGK